jgi:TolA-binding protein
VLQGQWPAPPNIPFDPNQLIPLFGMIGAFVVSGIVLWAFFKSDIAAALAERIRGRKKSSETVEGVDSGHVAELEQRVNEMQGQIAEMAERLDFAERLLASQKRERFLPGA